MKKPKKQRGKQVVQVAVVMSATRPSGRSHGDWACFVGLDKGTVIDKALAASAEWTRGAYGPYDVFVGTLTEVASMPKPKAKVVPIRTHTLSQG